MLCSLDKKNFKILIAIQIIIFSAWYSIGLSAPVLDDGYGIINFIMLYTLGAYYKRFLRESSLFQLSKSKLFLGYVLITTLTFILSYFINPFGYCFITNIISAILVFLFFCKVDLGQNKYINAISGVVFDVYFVHSDMYTSKLLFFQILKGKIVIGSMLMVPHLAFTIIAIYILGLCSFKIRNFIFSISINKILDNIPLINKNQMI